MNMNSKKKKQSALISVSTLYTIEAISFLWKTSQNMCQNQATNVINIYVMQVPSEEHTKITCIHFKTMPGFLLVCDSPTSV